VSTPALFAAAKDSEDGFKDLGGVMIKVDRLLRVRPGFGWPAGSVFVALRGVSHVAAGRRRVFMRLACEGFGKWRVNRFRGGWFGAEIPTYIHTYSDRLGRTRAAAGGTGGVAVGELPLPD